MTRIAKAPRCAVEATITITGGKWKPLILYYLLSGTKRFGELQRLIGGVTQRSLTLQLRQLEDHGVIRRQVFAQVPPRVDYSLTELGATLAPVLEAMKDWGETYAAHRRDHRGPSPGGPSHGDPAHGNPPHGAPTHGAPTERD